MNYTQKAEEILKSLFFEYYMTKQQWYGFLKEVNRKMNYGINALEHDLTRKPDTAKTAFRSLSSI